MSDSFDEMAARFTEGVSFAAGWKDNFYGASHAFRIRAAIDHLRAAIAVVESHPKMVVDRAIKEPEPAARQTVPDALEAIAAIYRERNGTYGDNYLHAGEVLLGMFPRGLQLQTAEDFNRFHLLVHMASKLSRYAMTMQLRGEGHRDSLDDLAVYAMMLRESDEIAAAGP